MVTYEQLLKQDRRWGFREGSMHFERESAVHKSLEKIVRRLEHLSIPYAVVGAMAMFFHGFERFTTDVDILVTKEGLKQLHDRLEGLGYVPPFAAASTCATRSLAFVSSFSRPVTTPATASQSRWPSPIRRTWALKSRASAS